MSPLASVPEPILVELRERYGEPGRAYHTWAHVEALLRWYVDVHEHLSDPVAVLYAVLFHDAVYDPLRGDNEAQSAELLRKRMVGALPPETLDRAVRLVEATHKHLVPDDSSEWEKSDMALFLDMDLSILGAHPEVFDAYESQVRTEYAHVPEPAFRAGRAAILRTFLERDRLYFSEWGRERFEAVARANLTGSIAALSA